MILVLFGQPHSGKSTIANKLIEDCILEWAVNIDGDKLRELFKNKDFSREGRLRNLNRASDIAVFLNDMTNDVILSLLYPYQEARDYLNSLTDDVKWVYLTYEGERGRENFHAKDFEIPTEDSILYLNTSTTNLDECITLIKKHIYNGELPS